MTWRFWSRLVWGVVAVVAAFLMIERTLYEWGEYRLRQVKKDIVNYDQDLYSKDQIGAGEVNGSELLDATATLARLALSEAEGDYDLARDTDFFGQAFELVQRHSHVYKAHADHADKTEPIDLTRMHRGTPVTVLFGKEAEQALRDGELDQYLQLIDARLVVTEWTARESPLPMNRLAALENAARTVAELGRDAPGLLHRVPESTHKRLRRLAQLDTAAPLKAEVAYMLTRSELEREQGRRRPGGVSGLMYRLAAIQGAPGVTATLLEALQAWLSQLQDPPYARDRKAVLERGGVVTALTETFMDITDTLEVAKVQLQIADAAFRYLTACVETGACPSSPQVRDANGDVLDLDPLSGEPWRFVSRGQQCVFYSVGLDGTDNLGELFVSGRLSEPGVDIGWLLPCGGSDAAEIVSPDPR